MILKLEELEEQDLYETEEEDEEYMATLEHDDIAGTIYSALKVFLKGKELGKVFGSSAEYRFIEEEATEQPGRKAGKQPDVSFLPKDKLPPRLRSYPEDVPAMACEVSSPTDREYLIEAKVALYQKYGVKLVWVVHPYSRRIDVYRLATKLQPESIPLTETLEGEDVIPGFKLAVAEIFDYPADPDPIPDPKPKSKRKKVGDTSV